jgi:hypothetical protein
MLTDSPPRKAKRAGFLESDRIKTLDLPPDGCLLKITQSIESAMKAGKNADVRRACTEFLAATSEFLRNIHMRCPCACSPTAESPRKLGKRAFRGLQSRDHVDPRMDADGGAEGDHLFRNISEHSLPRVLSPPRFSAVRISGFMAHSRFLRAHRCAIPPRAGNIAKAIVLVASSGRALADRLAPNESRVVTPVGSEATATCALCVGTSG